MDNLREKLMHYTDDLSEDVDLKQEAIATIEQAAQYMTEDELLHHSRALALAYLALTDAADVAPVVHGHWIEKIAADGHRYFECSKCGAHENRHTAIKGRFCWGCGAKMDESMPKDGGG
mgnify:CR=1 FL=1